MASQISHKYRELSEQQNQKSRAGPYLTENLFFRASNAQSDASQQSSGRFTSGVATWGGISDSTSKGIPPQSLSTKLPQSDLSNRTTWTDRISNADKPRLTMNTGNKESGQSSQRTYSTRWQNITLSSDGAKLSKRSESPKAEGDKNGSLLVMSDDELPSFLGEKGSASLLSIKKR